MATPSISKYSVLYPKNTFYTKGEEFSLDGKNYIGPYYVVNGKVWTGKPGNSNAKQLTEYYPDQEVYRYDVLRGFNVRQKTYTLPIYLPPAPITKDYELGYIYRYLAVSVMHPERIPTEISIVQANSFGKRGGIDPGLYVLITLKWVISGPATTIKSETTTIPGIEESNKATVQSFTTKYPTVLYVFKNYMEFAQPNIF